MSRQDPHPPDDEPVRDEHVPDDEEAVAPWVLGDVVRRTPLEPPELGRDEGDPVDEVAPWSLREAVERIAEVAEAPWNFLTKVWLDMAPGVPGTSLRWAAPWGVMAIVAVVVLAAMGVTSVPAYVAVCTVMVVMVWVGPVRPSDDQDG